MAKLRLDATRWSTTVWLSADQAHASCRPPEVTVAVPPVDRAAPTAVQPRRSPRMLMATRPSPQPSWTTHQGPTWAWWPDAGQATVEITSRPDANSEAARLQRRRSQKPANAPTTAVSNMMPRALTNHGSTAFGLVGGGSTAIPIPRSTTQATAPVTAQRPLIGSSSRPRSDGSGTATGGPLPAAAGGTSARVTWTFSSATASWSCSSHSGLVSSSRRSLVVAMAATSLALGTTCGGGVPLMAEERATRAPGGASYAAAMTHSVSSATSQLDQPCRRYGGWRANLAEPISHSIACAHRFSRNPTASLLRHRQKPRGGW